MDIKRVVIELKGGATAVITPAEDGSAAFDTYITMMQALDNSDPISTDMEDDFMACVIGSLKTYM